MKTLVLIFKNLIAIIVVAFFFSFTGVGTNNMVIDRSKLATKYYQADAQWYFDNVPFFECSDKTIEEVYYYRWKLYKAHIRNVGGEYGYVITEFIDEVDWDKKPYGTINAAAGHHILEGRWIKDRRYLDGYINYMYSGGGNDRHYSENVAYAAYSRYLVNADVSFIKSQQKEMQRVYEGWNDHYDTDKKLYYITPDRDATEYAIASLDASGGKDGWGGEGFRPTINCYMYANALAISRIANLNGNKETSSLYAAKASELKTTINQALWNYRLESYTDRYKVNNQYVKYWDFISGRELAGYVPWQYNIPDNTSKTAEAWEHLLDNKGLLGKYGLRTVEPSYKYYMTPFRYKAGETPECQWNGPSWPYQTSQELSGMANLLSNYTQNVVSPSDYVRLLHQYAHQHYLPNGKLDLQEDYDPDNDSPLVGLARSHHYNHSTYNDLIITGLCGLHPSEGNNLEIHPLVDKTITYFCLSDVQYHGHNLTIVYDRNGTKYKLGKGLTAFVDGKKAKLINHNGTYNTGIGESIQKNKSLYQTNLAVNLLKKGYPIPSASVNSVPDSLYKAIDGRSWYFAEIKNWWSTYRSQSITDWYALDFGQPREVSQVKLYLYADGKTYGKPDDYNIEYYDGKQWLPVTVKERTPSNPVGNTVNTVIFKNVRTKQIKVNFKQHSKGLHIAVSEIECY